MRLGGQGRGRRRPRQVVLVDAGVAVVALPDRLQQVHRQFERRQQRLMPDLLRRDLIDGRAQVVVRAFRPLGRRRAEERGVGRRVGAGIGILQLEVADDGQLIDDRRQRLQRRRQLEQLAVAARRPPRQVTAHRHVDETEPPHRLGHRAGERRHRRDHGIEQRQRHAGAQSSQERPPWQCFSGDDHRDALI